MCRSTLKTQKAIGRFKTRRNSTSSMAGPYVGVLRIGPDCMPKLTSTCNQEDGWKCRIMSVGSTVMMAGWMEPLAVQNGSEKLIEQARCSGSGSTLHIDIDNG